MIQHTIVRSGIILFIENSYYQLYKKLVESNRTTKREKFKTQSHHIIPRFMKSEVTTSQFNDKTNRVNVTYEDHILCHYYLCFCVEDRYQYSAFAAFLFLVGRIDMIKDTDNLSEKIQCNWTLEDVKEKCAQYSVIKEKLMKHEHEKKAGGKWMNNGIKQQYVPPSDIEYFQSIGWIVGKLPLTEEQRKRMSESRKGKDPFTRDEYWRKRVVEARSKPVSDAVKKKISETLKAKQQKPWNYGITYDEDMKKNCLGEKFVEKQFKAGNIPWNKGKHPSEETRKRMSDAAKARCRREKETFIDDKE